MRWGRLWRYAIALGISRTSKPSPPSWRTRSSSRARFGRPSTRLFPAWLTRTSELLVLDVQARGLEPPARHLGDQIGGVAEPLERHLRHVLEEAGGRLRAAGDEAPQAVAVEAVEERVRLGLARRRAVALVAEDAHLAERLARIDPTEHLLDPARDRLRNDDAALLEEEQLLAPLPRPEEHVAPPEAPLAEARPECAEHGLLHVLEQRHSAEELDLGGCHQVRPASGPDGRARRRRPPRWPIAST